MKNKTEFLRRYVHACGSYIALLEQNSPYQPFFACLGLEHALWYIYADLMALEPDNRAIADFVTEIVHDYKDKKLTIEQAFERINTVEELRRHDE